MTPSLDPMGDRRRFSLFAELLARNFPHARDLPVADVAAGKGHLRAAMREHGFRRVICWDRRGKMAAGRASRRYQLFDYRTAPSDYAVAVGMHPDEASDHIVLWAVTHGRPFALCPCCVKPSASVYWGSRSSQGAWIAHLAGLARDRGFAVAETSLPMHGRNVVLLGRPPKGR